MPYDIQFTVIIYKNKTFISHLAAIALGLQQSTMLLFGTRTLVEVNTKDKAKIADYPVYNMDSDLKAFVAPHKTAEVVKVDKKECISFEGMTFIPLSKMKQKNKYSLRFSLPAVKLFGTYFILCGKQKDINTRLVAKPE